MGGGGTNCTGIYIRLLWEKVCTFGRHARPLPKLACTWNSLLRKSDFFTTKTKNTNLVVPSFFFSFFFSIKLFWLKLLPRRTLKYCTRQVWEARGYESWLTTQCFCQLKRNATTGTLTWDSRIFFFFFSFAKEILFSNWGMDVLINKTNGHKRKKKNLFQ